jgi:hypothetical protein
MRNYNAHDIQNWVQGYIEDFQYLIVAHTTYRPKNKSFLGIEKALRTNSSKLEDSLKYVSRNLYENDPYLPFKNREKFGLHLFTTSEFIDPNVRDQDTMHFNVMIGNVPSSYTQEMLKEDFLHAWKKEHRQSSNVWVYNTQELVDLHGGEDTPTSVFNRYILKDAYKDKSKAWKVDSTWNVQNLWLPPKSQVA